MGGDPFPLSWTWNAVTEQPYVKGFPQVYYGVALWLDSATTSRLPRRLDTIDTLRVRHDIAVEANGIYNLAFDLWITADDTPEPAERTHEIMVWLEGNVPIDRDRIGEASVGGDAYDFYHWEHQAGYTYYMFVAQTPRPNDSTDLKRLLDYLVSNEDLPSSSYLSTIELGTEIWWGSGAATVNDFAVTLVERR